MYRGVGTGPAGIAIARPMFPEPTIKKILYLYLQSSKLIKNYITAACLYHFNKGIALLRILSKEQDTNLLRATTSLQIRHL